MILKNEKMPTRQVLEALKKGGISVEEHVKGYINAIKSRNQHLNVFLHVNEQGAIEEARRLDEKRKGLNSNSRNEKLGKLFGLCIGIKSNIAVKGLPLTCASATL